jgi:RES domain-containing protein
MQLWRICRERYADVAYAREGARLHGGRWNSKGSRVAYTSTSLALAAVEMFVNLEPKLRPADLVSIEAEVPGDVRAERLDMKSLPRDWHQLRDESLRAFGDRWIRNATSTALYVPSAAIRGEWNVLLNPDHPDFPKLKFQNPKPLEFDLRMFR